MPEPFSPTWAHVPCAIRGLWGCYQKVAESLQFRACTPWQGLIWSGLGILKWDIWGWATYPKPSFRSMKGKKWEQFHHKFNKLLPGSAFFSPIFLTRSLGWLAVVQTSICQRSEIKGIQPRKDYTDGEEPITRTLLQILVSSVPLHLALKIQGNQKTELGSKWDISGCKHF